MSDNATDLFILIAAPVIGMAFLWATGYVVSRMAVARLTGDLHGGWYPPRGGLTGAVALFVVGTVAMGTSMYGSLHSIKLWNRLNQATSGDVYKVTNQPDETRLHDTLHFGTCSPAAFDNNHTLMTLMGVQMGDRGRHLLVRFTNGGCIIQGVMERHDVGAILLGTEAQPKLSHPAFETFKKLG